MSIRAGDKWVSLPPAAECYAACHSCLAGAQSCVQNWGAHHSRKLQGPSVKKTKPKLSKDSINIAKAANEKEKSNKFGPGISCWIETYVKKEIYCTKDKSYVWKLIHMKGHAHSVSSSLDLALFFFFPLDKENQDFFIYDKGSTFPCIHGGCVSHLQICEFISDCPVKEEGVRCGEYAAWHFMGTFIQLEEII